MKSSNETGVVIVLFALAITAIFFGLVLALDGALYTSQDANLKSVSDLTALSALDAYAKNPVNPLNGIPNESARRVLGKDYGDYILREHQLLTASDPLGGLDLSGASASDLRYGSYFADAQSAQGSGTPCESPNTIFPCWAESTNLSPEPASSVLVKARTQANNPIIGFFSSQPLNLEATSVATVVESCLVTALDVSRSTVDQTHNPWRQYCVNRTGFGSIECPAGTMSSPPPACHPEYCSAASGNLSPSNQNPAILLTDPVVSPLGSGTRPTSVVSNFVFDENVVRPGGVEIDCSDFSAVVSAGNQGRIWCSMHENRQRFLNARGLTPVDLPADLFFRSDYVPIVAGGGIGPQKRVLVNAFRHPEPFRTFMLTANATGRLLFGSSSQHSALNLAFTGDIMGRSLPLVSNGQYLLSQNLEAMTQLTNMNFLPRVDATGALTNLPRYPNLMDWLFFVDSTASGALATSTNVPRALHVAAEAIAYNNQISGKCGDTASKQIMLMTDGISTCSYFDSSFTSSFPNEFDCSGSSFLQPFDRYVRSEVALLTDLKDYLVNRGIIVNTMTSLPGTRYKNLLSPGKTSACMSDDSDADCFMSPWTAGQFASPGNPIGIEMQPPTPSAASAGFDLAACDPSAFIDCSSRDSSGAMVSDQVAFDAVNGGDETFRFRRPANVLARLSYLTGGIYCPLLPLTNLNLSDYVDHDSDHSIGSGCTLASNELCCAESSLQGTGTPCILRNTARATRLPPAWETRPSVLATPSGQAYLCALQAVGLSPYVVKKPKQIFCPTCNT